MAKHDKPKPVEKKSANRRSRWGKKHGSEGGAHPWRALCPIAYGIARAIDAALSKPSRKQIAHAKLMARSQTVVSE